MTTESAEANTGAESKEVPESVRREAREMGWVPKERFPGDPDRWIDADEYVRRGRERLPLIQAHNRRLENELRDTKGQLQALSTKLEEASSAIEALKEVNSDANRRALQRSRADLLRQLRQAREDGRLDDEFDAQDKLSEVTAELREAEKKPAAREEKPVQAEQKIDPVFLEWVEDNPWFKSDDERRGFALGVAGKLRKDPSYAHLVGRAFYDKVAERVEELFGDRRSSKVDGGTRTGGERSSGGSAGKSYADLPADAKEACDKQAARLSGAGKAFKDVAAYRAHYAKIYFSEE
jgi:hypothetical protein